MVPIPLEVGRTIFFDSACPSPCPGAFGCVVLLEARPLDVTGRRFTNNTCGTKDDSEGSVGVGVGGVVDDGGCCGCLGVITREVG